MHKTKLSMSEIKSSIGSVFHMVTITKQTHAELMERLKPIFEELNSRTKSKKRRYSLFLVGYARGIEDAHYASLYKDHLEFCYKAPDGTIYSTHKESSHKKTAEFYDSGRGCELANMPSGNYWRGTNSLFFGDSVK